MTAEEDEVQDLESLIGRIPEFPSFSPRPVLRCCCGHANCAYLKHNCLALDDLEKEVRQAASLGQALLVRHEQYMHDAELDRLEMNSKIEKLEADKKELEDANAKTIEENRGLLDQLESVNTTLTESEAHVKSLEATLHSTRQELRRLEVLASRTRDLEAQFLALELEQEVLQNTITTSQDEERSAIQRWRKAERRLNDLQDQLERIEREAREERERHVEVLGRMERQRVVERELDTAAGRLKGAAAYTAGNGKHGSSVVSHFVKDILQDNANLQLGIVELKEMLVNSNDEVQMLREQLLMHQPVEDKEAGSGPPTLRAELAPQDPNQTEQKIEPQVVSQALHIHHHYHAPKKDEIRRPKKKRTSLNNALFTPPRHLQSPRTSRDSASAILSQTSVTVPAPVTPSNRWSMQSAQTAQMSDFAPSSVPSSPHSYRNSTLFDRYDFDSSRPTSPGSSVDPMSPQFQPQFHKKRGSEASTRQFATPSNFQSHVIHEEQDGDIEEITDLETPSLPSLDNQTEASEASHDSEFVFPENAWTQPSLRRTSSHESILSISGIDIHTLKSRPSQLNITRNSLLFRSPSRPGPPSTIMSVETMTGASMITAQPTLTRHGHNSTSYLRSTVMGNDSDTRSVSSSGSKDGNAPKTGGWLFSRWGVSPAKSNLDLRGSSSNSVTQRRVASTPAVDPMKAFMGRSAGINQKGPIMGFAKKVDRVPSKVTAERVDHDALQEVLEEGGGS